MNWDAIAAVAELIAALGVIVSLVYVAAQIRQNTRSIRASTHQAFTEIFADINQVLGRDADSMRVFVTGRERIDELDDVDRGRFISQMLTVFLTLESAFDKNRAGLLDQQHWERVERMLGWYLREPGVVTFWRIMQGWYTEDFASYVDSELAGLGQKRVAEDRATEMVQIDELSASREGE